jgi:teichuronic acid biosynthesis glycosyltransferase TuaH
MEATPAAMKAYYVTDPFEYFAWPRAQTLEFERRVLEVSDIVVATSIQLADDFRTRVNVPVVHVPNAVSQSFLDALRRPLPRPARLGAINGPIIGVIGQINDSYDWDLLEALSRELPDVTTVFVGPVMRSETSTERFDALVARPNVVWIGPQPHAELPEYLAAFDVCLNPLRRDERNDRRSPLRLFDYSATEVPIASTAIREASILSDQVSIIESAEHGPKLIRELLDGPTIDLSKRQAWAQQNTWEARARVWLDLVDEQLDHNGPPTVSGT